MLFYFSISVAETFIFLWAMESCNAHKSNVLPHLQLLAPLMRLKPPPLAFSAVKQFSSRTWAERTNNIVCMTRVMHRQKCVVNTLYYDCKRQNNVDVRFDRFIETYGPRMAPNDNTFVLNFWSSKPLIAHSYTRTKKHPHRCKT